MSTTGLPEFLLGGGEMGARIRAFNWAETPLGPVSTWPQSLKTCIRIMLTSRQPIWLGWGKELIKLYNDPYKDIVRGKHTWALGQPASIVWKEVWEDIGPMLKKVMEQDEGIYVESQLLIMERNGYPEETYYTFSYTPIPGDDGRTAGMICANTDDTERIISDRHLKTLTQLGKGLADCKQAPEVTEKTIACLRNNRHDFPFALFYTFNNGKAVLTETSDPGLSTFPVSIDLETGCPFAVLLKTAMESRKLQILENDPALFTGMPQGAWKVTADTAIILPIMQATSNVPYGFLVFGKNPYCLADEKYCSFFNLLADQVATSFANVNALEQERKRIAALAEIDSAKTTFFSNISHEFRTPLTLLLAPVEETLNDPQTPPEIRTRMELAFRNALRMQKLVNTLLEFSRIEAGRVEGKFTRVDLGSLTANLASVFRSAIEKAGMQLDILQGKIEDEVYVDIDMWEKIILNLISNAIKYSERGNITIDIRQENGHAHVAISDNGIGIDEDQLQKIFERFHRIESTGGRSIEGTGIGLAMVKELVRLHHGTIQAHSRKGSGSTFTVSIPLGKAHISPQRIVESAANNYATGHFAEFVSEALKWIPDTITPSASAQNGGPALAEIGQAESKRTVLLADDNTDLRDYLHRILSQQFRVITATDGEDAYSKALQHKPDLLLSDIMMPKLDGLGLLRKIRDHHQTRDIPVILLSARAGEEAKIEGIATGADDYLIKPFSAKEVVAKVDAHLKIALSRRQAEQHLRSFLMQAPAAIAIVHGPEHIYTLANAQFQSLSNKTENELIGQSIRQIWPEIEGQGILHILNHVFTTGQPYTAIELPTSFNSSNGTVTGYYDYVVHPILNSEGHVADLMIFAHEVTDKVLARKTVEESEQNLRQLADSMPQIVWTALPDGRIDYYNNRLYEYAGFSENDNTAGWLPLLHPADRQHTIDAWDIAVASGNTFETQHRLREHSGEGYRWFLAKALPIRNNEGIITKWIGSTTDIDDQKRFEEKLESTVEKRTRELQRSNEDLMHFAHVASHDLKEPVRKIKTFEKRLHDEYAELLPERGQTYIRKVLKASDRMLSVIEGILRYSAISASDQPFSQIDLNDLVANIQSDLEVLIQQKGATIKTGSLPVIEGEPILIHQLLYNIIQNAVKFSRDHESSSVSVSGSCITIDDIEYAQIVVQDNGIGFDEQYAVRIFETFARLHPADRYEGTGLGLALCKKIAERHGGSIVARSQVNRGAEFIITLPIHHKKESL